MKPCFRILTFSIAALVPILGNGATLTWDIDAVTAGAQGGSGNWLAPSRWLEAGTNKTWVVGSDAIFGGTAGTVTLNANTLANSLTFNSSYTIAGAGVLTLASSLNTGITVASGATASIGVDITFDSVAILNKRGAGTLAFSGAIDSGTQFTVEAGTLRLDAGATTNGALSVQSGGTLRVAGASSAAALQGNGNIQLESTLSLPATVARSATFSGNIAGPGTLILGSNNLGGLTQTFSGTNTFTNLDLRSTLLILSSAGALSPQVEVNQSGGEIDLDGIDRSFASLSGVNNSSSFPGRIFLNSASLTVGSSNASTTYEGRFRGSGDLRKVGTGKLVLTNDFSDQTGGVFVEAGTVSVANVANTGAVSPLGAGGALVLGAAAVSGELEFTGAGVDSTNRSMTLAGTGGGVIDVTSATGELTWAGTISGTGTFRKRGAGELTLSGANTLSGPVNVTAGRLSLANASALSTAGMVALSNSAGVELSIDASTSIRGLAGGGSLGGNLALGTRSLLINQDVDSTFGGVISGTGGAGIFTFNKLGSGTLTLTGANTFTQDLRIQEGVLAVGSIGPTSTSNPLGQALAVALGAASTSGTLRYTGPSASFSRSLTVGAGGGALDVQLAATRLDFGGTLGGNGRLVKTGGGEFAPSGLLGFTGELAIERGTWEASTWANTGALSRLGSGNGIALGSGSGGLGRLRYTGPTGSSNRQVSIIGEGEIALTDPAAVFTLTNGLSGGGVRLRKDGPGMLVLAGDSAFTGEFQILTGPVRLTHIGALDSVSNVALLNSPNTNLELADIPSGSYVIPNLSGNAQSGNGLALGAEDATLLQTSSTSFLGTISGNNASGALLKSGPGNLTLAGQNTFLQGLHIADGTLSVAVINAPANPGPLGATATITFGTNSTRGTFAFTGGVGLTNSRAITINPGGAAIETTIANLTQSGVISGSGALLKTGAGTLSLFADNPLNGPVLIEGGLVRLNNAGGLDQSSLVTIGTGSTLAVNVDASLVAIDGGGTLALASSSLALTGGANATVSGLITGSSEAKSFTKRAVGTLTLSNAANSFLQNVVIENGAISVSSMRNIGQVSALGAGSTVTLGALGTQGSLVYTGASDISNRPITLDLGGGVIEIANPATQMTLSGAITGLGNLVKAGAGRLLLQGANTWAGHMLIQGGELLTDDIADVGVGSNLGAGNLIALAPGTQFTFLGAEAAPGSTNRSVAISNGGTIKTASELTLRTGISGAGELRKIGAERLVLSGAATFTGTVSIDEGGLVLATGDALSIAEGIEFDGPGKLGLSVSSQLQRLRSGTTPGQVDLGASALTLRIPTTGAASSFSGVIEGTGKLIKAGGGAFTLSGGASTFSGGFEIRAGLVVTADIANSGQPSSLGSDGVITLGEDATFGALQFTGVAGVSNRPINLEGAGGVFLVSNAAGGLALSGGISGSGDLTKTGPGRLTLAGTSSMTGRLQVGQGTLRLDGTLSAGPDSLQINPGATVTGGGVANRPVTIQGTLAPIGTFSTGTLALQSNSTLALNFASPSSFDRVSTTGSVSLTGTVNLLLALQYDPTDFVDSFVVLLNDGTDPITGRLTVAANLLDQAERFSAAGQQWEIRYDGGDGNDLTLLAIPEPSCASCLLVASGLLGLARRRQTALR